MTTVVDNSTITSGISSIGEGFTEYYGQTFVAAGSQLNTVEVDLRAHSGMADGLEFRLLISTATFTGNDFNPGTVLFESAVISVTNTTSYEHVTVDIGNLNVTPGQTYAFIIDAFATKDGTMGGASQALASGYTGGYFVFTGAPGATRADNFATNWAEATNLDAAFKLTFDANAAPTIDLDGSEPGVGYVTTVTEDGPPVSIGGPDIVLADTDSTTITGLIIELANRQDGDELVLGNSAPFNWTATVFESPGYLRVETHASQPIEAYADAIRAFEFLTLGSSTVDRIINISTVDDTGLVSNVATTTVRVQSVNDAPAGTDKSVYLNEDTAHTFLISDFGFTDEESDGFQAVTITSVPTDGELTLDGVAVADGQSIDTTDIAAGRLVFTPAANGFGAGYTSLTFQVRDDGPDGNNLDLTPKTFTINVTGVDDEPTAESNTVTILEDAAYSITFADIGFFDVDGHSFQAVFGGTLPATGTLTRDGVPLLGNYWAANLATLTAGNLRYVPVANASGTVSMDFHVQDFSHGGIGSRNQSLIPNTLTINILPVNDAPEGANKTVTTLEDTAYVLKVADFGFSDIEGDAFTSVKFAALPSAGKLTLNGASVATGQFVSVADIASGKLKFMPARDGNGSNYASLTFQVKDGGGTANGGLELDQTANRLTFNVTPVADVINGTGGKDKALVGTAFAETINGLAGNDVIKGLGGNDRIVGGAGADTLWGGAGADTFVYISIADSARGQSGMVSNAGYSAIQGQAQRDVIMDFTPGTDRIDVSAIDANAIAAGNQAFAWRGTGAFSRKPGELIAKQFNPAGTSNDNTIIYGDLNGDARADFQIELFGLKTLKAADLVL